MIVSSSCHCTLSDSVHVNKETDWCLSLIFIFCSTRVRWCCHEMTDKLLVSGQNIFFKGNMFLVQRWLDEKYLLVPGVHITEAGDTECLKIIWRLQWSYYRMAKFKSAELLSHPNATLAPQARASGEILNYLLSQSDILVRSLEDSQQYSRVIILSPDVLQ